MSLDLLKERFGGGKSTDKKESDKQKLNEMFISKPAGDIKSFKAQYQDELAEKDRIIESHSKSYYMKKASIYVENLSASTLDQVIDDSVASIVERSLLH